METRNLDRFLVINLAFEKLKKNRGIKYSLAHITVLLLIKKYSTFWSGCGFATLSSALAKYHKTMSGKRIIEILRTLSNDGFLLIHNTKPKTYKLQIAGENLLTELEKGITSFYRKYRIAKKDTVKAKN